MPRPADEAHPVLPPSPPSVVTAQFAWVNPSGVKYDIEVSQNNGRTLWRVKGTTQWNHDPTTFYNSLGANIQQNAPVVVTPTLPPPTPPASVIQEQQQQAAREATWAAAADYKSFINQKTPTANATRTPVARFRSGKRRGRWSSMI